MAGADGNTVDDDLSQTVHYARSEVLRAGGRAGIDYHQIVLGQRRDDGAADHVEVIGQRRKAADHAAPLLGHRAQHDRVVLDDVARLQAFLAVRVIEAHQFGAGGDDGDARLATHSQMGMAAADRCAKVLRAQLVVGWQHQLSRHDVLAHGPHVPPGRRGGHDLNYRLVALANKLRVLDHNHRVGEGGQRVAGINICCFDAQDQPFWHGLGSASGVLGAHRVAVHRGRVVVRR